jgi:hypothetical protein
VLQGLPAASSARGQSAHPEPGPAPGPAAQVVRPAPGLHHGQVRHEPVHPRDGRGVPGAGRRGQFPLAVDRHRHRRHPRSWPTPPGRS